MPNVFEGGDNQPASEESLVDQLVGEGKKFNSIEDLAKGKAASDTHIDNLESQLAGMKEELDKRMTSEDQITRLLSERNQERQENPSVGGTTPTVSQEELAELVRQTVDQSKSEDTAKGNETKANEHLHKLYGDKASEVVANKARELGLSVDFMQSVARKSPEAFYNTLGIESSRQSVPTLSGDSVNTEVLHNQPGSSGPKPNTYAWYEAKRKENPRQFWDAKVQAQLFKDRQEMGDGFYN
jgi:hypothetical protein|tara:strand:+ start:104 stop:826 length:723 start_codon:yes stop_codon:yes gene_type:complete